MHRQGFLMLSCFLICTACNPYGSKRLPVGNSVYLQQAQPVETIAQTTSKDPNEPSIINLQPEQQAVFADVLPDNDAKEIPDFASGKNVKIYKQPKARAANANKAKFIKIKPAAKPGSKASIKSTKNPYGTVVSEDITSKVKQQQPSTPDSNQVQQNTSQQNTPPQNTAQQTTEAQKVDTFVPLSDTPAKTYTDQEQKSVLANKQADQQAVSDRADQLQLPQQVSAEQMGQMPKAAPAPQPASPSFEQMKTITQQQEPISAQQTAQLEAQVTRELNEKLAQATQNLNKAQPSNAPSDTQSSKATVPSAIGSVSADSTTARNAAPPSLPAAPKVAQSNPPPAKAAYDLKSKPIPQF